MTWPQNAYVGQKVVCINEGGCSCNCPQPKLNEIFTISAVSIQSGSVAIQLKEIEIKHTRFHTEWAFVKYFRPAQSTETGMKILTEILLTQKVKENA